MLRTKQIQKLHKVLIVDDQELNRDILGAILEDDYEIAYACDGLEAMDYLKKNTESLSLVMLDLIMPNKNGFEDSYSKDGKKLVEEANALIKYYTTHSEELGKYRLVIIP